MSESVFVSVIMLVYNHERYLQQALDSILSQKFDEKIEIVIGEDCSTDNSREIVQNYESTYPNIIKPIYHDHNVGMNENLKQVLLKATGKYIAFLEGDDFWIDNCELQRQIDFLESNLDYSGTTHNVVVVDEYGNENRENQKIYSFHIAGDYSLNELLEGVQPGQTASFVFRNFYLNMTSQKFNKMYNYKMNGDVRFLLTMLLEGKVYCMEERMSAYRYVTTHGDSWNARAASNNLSDYYYMTAKEIERFAYEEYGTTINARKKRHDALTNSILFVIRNKRKMDLEKFNDIWLQETEKKDFCYYILKKIILHIGKKIKSTKELKK